MPKHSGQVLLILQAGFIACQLKVVGHILNAYREELHFTALFNRRTVGCCDAWIDRTELSKGTHDYLIRTQSDECGAAVCAEGYKDMHGVAKFSLSVSQCEARKCVSAAAVDKQIKPRDL